MAATVAAATTAQFVMPNVSLLTDVPDDVPRPPVFELLSAASEMEQEPVREERSEEELSVTGWAPQLA